jgi:hypothetical protein
MATKKKTTAQAESDTTTTTSSLADYELVQPGGISKKLLERREATRKFEEEKNTK